MNFDAFPGVYWHWHNKELCDIMWHNYVTLCDITLCYTSVHRCILDPHPQVFNTFWPLLTSFDHQSGIQDGHPFMGGGGHPGRAPIYGWGWSEKWSSTLDPWSWGPGIETRCFFQPENWRCILVAERKEINFVGVVTITQLFTGLFSFSLGSISASNTKKTSSSGTKSLELINASVAKLLQDARPMFATY